MLQSLQSLFGGGTDRRSERLGFPSTASLLDQLPKDTKASRDRHAHKGGGSFKKSRPGRRPSWAPKHGGDAALMAGRAYEKRPDIAARSELTADSGRLLLVLVGLPARGKSLLSHKLELFLAWRGWKTKAFSAGAKRRDASASAAGRWTAESFFANASARETAAFAVLAEVLAWFDGGGEIAIFDATNSSAARRQKLVDYVSPKGVQVVFIESIVRSPTLLFQMMKKKVAASPDFYGLDEAAAMADLKARIELYEQQYQSCSEADGAYIKLSDLSTQVVAHRIYGRMASEVLPFLLSLHFVPRPIYLVSAPPDGADGFDAAARDRFAASLAAWADKQDGELQVLSSTHPTARHAAAAAAATRERRGESKDAAHLVELGPSALAQDRGRSSPTPPRHYDDRGESGGGESVGDLVRRLEHSVLEIESRLAPVLVVAHAAPCRALRAYLLGLPLLDALNAGSADDNADGAAALADGGHAIVELRPLDAKLGFEEHRVPLKVPAAAKGNPDHAVLASLRSGGELA